MRRRIMFFVLASAGGFGAVLAFLLILAGPVEQVRADPGELYVAPGGDCGGASPCYDNVQAAVDEAVEGDVIKVATGVYTGVQIRPAPAGYGGPSTVVQIVYVSKTVTIQGGYTTTNWGVSDPISYPTTLDAQRGGRVLFITGDVSPTVEGVRITGGNAVGLGGHWSQSGDAGGGMYVISATATISNVWVFDNVTLAGTAMEAEGGGGFFIFAQVALNNSRVFNNAARSAGGLSLHYDTSSLHGNTIMSNTAEYGGGLSLHDSQATLDRNVIAFNDANYGGGLHLKEGSPLLESNTIISNHCTQCGGGAYISSFSFARLVNTVIADNQSQTSGGGLCVRGNSFPSLLHATIARNGGGDGTGIYIGTSLGTDHNEVILTNTVLVSHTVGVYVRSGSTARLESTLWHGNSTNWSGANIIHVNDYTGDPAFIAPDVWDYHIGPLSAAIDKGVDAGVKHDMEGQMRPMSWGYDLGVDEASGAGLGIIKKPSDTFVNVGQMLTYTIVITSTGTESVTSVILTDTLPVWQHVVSVTSPLGNCSIADAGWGGAVVCSPGTMVTGTTVVITLTAQVSGTVPVGQEMVNDVIVLANETANSAQVATYAQDCHVRLNEDVTEYITIQAALDVANPGDLIRVAGICVGAGEREGLHQQVYLNTSVVVRGGYTITNWTISDPDANPTTLDALGQGRVFYIAGNVSPTVEGLRIIGGDASDLGGYDIPEGYFSYDAGGGVYIADATVVFSNNHVSSNTADIGGGIYLVSDSSLLSNNTVRHNTAAQSGGGVALVDYSDATLSENVVVSNTAYYGGGIYLENDSATLDHNLVISNTADNGGGGLYLDTSNAMLSENIIIGNRANYPGGGLYSRYSDIALLSNIIVANSAGSWGGGLLIAGGPAVLVNNTICDNNASAGGGLVLESSPATLSNNMISDNDASEGGGGVFLNDSPATVSDNTVIANTAKRGGGVFLGQSDATLINNVIADNQASVRGSGLYVEASFSRLAHTTIARNTGGDGSGIYVVNAGLHYSNVTLANTILVSHTVGITAAVDTVVTLESTLWGDGVWANGTDWDGAGTIVTGTVNVWGAPAFVNPDAGDYHIGPGSAAINAGVEAGVTEDIDGDPRPMGGGYDIGADEFGDPALIVVKQAATDVVQAGEQLTYTINVTNTGGITLTAIITDVLPDRVTPSGTLTWTAEIPAPGVWTETVVVTVALGYSGPLTNVVHVTTEEGATGVYTEVIQAEVTPALAIGQWALPDPVPTGEQLTYTLRITNTGNVTLTMAVTDVLPGYVSPTGVLTWTEVSVAPGEAWEQTVVVTVAFGYEGPLTNVVQVTTEEGATGYLEISSDVVKYSVYLPVVRRE